MLKEQVVNIQRLSRQQAGYKIQKGVDESSQNEMIDVFMQNAQLLVDQNYDLRNMILSILVKLTGVQHCDFLVKRCFETLRNMMMAGKDLQDQIIAILKSEVISMFAGGSSLQMSGGPMLSKSLLMGLYEFVYELEEDIEKQAGQELLGALLRKFFPDEIKLFTFKMESLHKQ